jgi:hypothetical protein
MSGPLEYLGIFLGRIVELSEEEYEKLNINIYTKEEYVETRIRDIAQQLFWVTDKDRLRRIFEHTHTVGSYEEGEEETGHPNF